MIERVSLLFGTYALGVSVYTVYHFLSFLYDSEKEPVYVLTDNWKERLIVDFGLILQFIIFHVLAKADTIKRFFSGGNHLFNTFGIVYALTTSLSLYVSILSSRIFFSLIILVNNFLLASCTDLFMEYLKYYEYYTIRLLLLSHTLHFFNSCNFPI
jgi:hypothetical protein